MSRRRHPHWPSISNAFLKWLNAQPQDVRDEIVASKRRGRVRLRFPRFRSLTGRVWRHFLAVYADDDQGENYDRLFDADCLPIRVEETERFVCGICDSGERKEFEGREALWQDHLFEPFGEWVFRKLKPAFGVEYHRMGGVTWARLRLPNSPETFDEDDLRIDNGGVGHLRYFKNAPQLPEKGLRKR